MQNSTFHVVLVALAVLCTGCATYTQRITRIRGAYYSNDLAGANKIVADSLPHDQNDGDLLKLEQAIIELSAGNPQTAEQLLREVRDRFDARDGADARRALSYLTDDTRRTYPGEDHEKVLIRAFLALSNLMHDGGDAEAYSLQMIDKQEQIIAAGADKQGQNPKQNYPRVAVAPYLRGVLREATFHDYDDAERSYVSVVHWQPWFQAGKQDLERAVHGHHSAPGNGVLYLFALTGRGPFKVEVVEAPSSASLFIASEIVSAAGKQTVPPNVAPVKVPQLMAHQNSVAAIALNVDSQPRGATETITDVTRLAIQQYEAIYPTIVARAVARRVLKNGVVYGTKEVVGVEKGSLPGLAFDLAGLAWQAAESADTRCWGLLPDKIQVLRVELPAGDHEISLRPVAANGATLGAPATQTIRIADGRNTYVLANFPDRQLVGKVLVSQP